MKVDLLKSESEKVSHYAEASRDGKSNKVKKFESKKVKKNLLNFKLLDFGFKF